VRRYLDPGLLDGNSSPNNSRSGSRNCCGGAGCHLERGQEHADVASHRVRGHAHKAGDRTLAALEADILLSRLPETQLWESYGERPVVAGA
jgi:hypothetical protein